MSDKLWLHIGCGKRDFGPDWVHIDGEIKYPHVKHHDIVNLTYPSGSADLIYACHVLAYFDRDEAVRVLAEWLRVLKSGGVMRIAVPDFEAMAILYVRDELPLSLFLGPLYGKMEMRGEMIYERTVYDMTSLRMLMESAGLIDVRAYDWRRTEHAQFDDHSQAYIPHMDKENGMLISLNMQGTKP